MFLGEQFLKNTFKKISLMLRGGYTVTLVATKNGSEQSHWDRLKYLNIKLCKRRSLSTMFLPFFFSRTLYLRSPVNCKPAHPISFSAWGLTASESLMSLTASTSPLSSSMSGFWRWSAWSATDTRSGYLSQTSWAGEILYQPLSE